MVQADGSAAPPRGRYLRDQKAYTMRTGSIAISVDAQDQAERFYTEALGFQVKTSAPTALRALVEDDLP